MGKTSCTIHPRVKGADGRPTPSILFGELRKELDYKDAREAYLRTKNPEFDARYGGSPRIALDANGEPTVGSLSRLPEFRDLLGQGARLRRAEARAGAGKAETATREHIDAADRRAVEFNRKAEAGGGFVAATETFTDSDGIEKVRVVVLPDTSANRLRASEPSRKRRLNERLRSMLGELGVSVGTMEGTEEALRKAGGVTDFESAKLLANGMVELIRLAKGEEGEEALPEEFAHLVLEALSDNPVVSRLRGVVAGAGLARRILGDGYDAYKEAYGGDEGRLVDEAMGKLVARHILAGAGIGDGGYGDGGGLVRRMVGYFRDKFSRQDDRRYTEALREADALAGEFAKAVMDEGLYREVDVKDIKSDSRYYSLSKEVDAKARTLHELLKAKARQVAVLGGRDPEGGQSQDDAALQSMVVNYKGAQYEAGVVDYLQSALDELKTVSESLHNMAAHPEDPTAKRARVLRRCNDFVHSYLAGLSAVRDAVRDGTLGDDAGRDAMLSQATQLVADLQTDYERLANGMFVEFIKGFVGDGVEVPYGKLKGKVYTAEELASYADNDISFFDRWLDSMADSTDMVLTMFDATVKRQRSYARQDTLEVKERIERAWAKLRAAGYGDTEFMYRRDAAGGDTFEYIGEEEAALLPEAQRVYWEEAMGIYKELVDRLPDGAADASNVIRIRKDMLDRCEFLSDFVALRRDNNKA